MKGKTLLTVCGVLFIIFALFLLKSINSDVKYVNEIVQNLKDDSRFGNIIESAQAKYDKNENNMEINIELKDDYDNLSNMQKFSLLDHFNKLLIYNIENNNTDNTTEHNPMIVIAKTTTNQYRLSNSASGKNVFTDSKSTMYINERKAFTSNDFKQQKNKYLANLPTGSLEKEILDYANYFYTFLTHSGKYFELNKDPEIIIEAVCKKFHISQLDFMKIYIINILKMIDASQL